MELHDKLSEILQINRSENTVLSGTVITLSSMYIIYLLTTLKIFQSANNFLQANTIFPKCYMRVID